MARVCWPIKLDAPVPTQASVAAIAVVVAAAAPLFIVFPSIDDDDDDDDTCSRLCVHHILNTAGSSMIMTLWFV